MIKTNVMRILDSKHIDYKVHYYDENEAISAVEVANYLNEDVNRLFKTLVTVSKSKQYYVFIVPGTYSLDLKKASKVCNEKSIEMIKQKDLLPLTGYVHGGCSPIGMKKQFKTFIDKSVDNFDTFFISGGKRGVQIELSFSSLNEIINVIKEDIICD